MGLLYVNENGTLIGFAGNRRTVTCKDGMKKSIPIESLEGITVMGRPQVTTKCEEKCMRRAVKNDLGVFLHILKCGRHQEKNTDREISRAARKIRIFEPLVFLKTAYLSSFLVFHANVELKP